MVGFVLIFFRWLLSRVIRSLHLMLVVGVFFRSLSGLMQRLIDLNEFAVLQDRLFASCNTVNSELLGAAAAPPTPAQYSRRQPDGRSSCALNNPPFFGTSSRHARLSLPQTRLAAGEIMVREPVA